MATLKLGQSNNKDILNEVNNSVKLTELNELSAIDSTTNVGKSFLNAKLPADLQSKDYSFGFLLKDSANKLVGSVETFKSSTDTKVHMELFDDIGANPKSIGVVKNDTGTYISASVTQDIDDSEVVTNGYFKNKLNTAIGKIVSARFPKVLKKNVDFTITTSNDLSKGKYEITFTKDQEGGLIPINAAGEVVLVSINWDISGATPKLGKCYSDVEDIQFITFVTKVI